MKIVCECGQEFAVHSPPLVMEIALIVIRHAFDGHRPDTMKAVCACGSERMIGPGTGNWNRDRDAKFKAGELDGQWFKKHAACGTN